MAKNAYQANLSSPIEQQDDWNARSVMGKIYQIAQVDQADAQKFYKQFRNAQNNPKSDLYNPYAQPTNRSVSNLQSYGFDTKNLNDQWINKNRGWITSNLQYNGTTNTPSKPGKKSTWDQLVAYEIYQWEKSEGDTKKAETEWAALQEELSYWANRKDLNYSDDQIMDMIDWSKYKTLAKMDENKYTAPTELNREIGYSKDAMYGVLWGARNQDYQGDIYGAMANSYLGNGNTWVEDPDTAAKLNWNDKNTYSPYEVAMTANDLGLYFGYSSFDQDTIDYLRKTIDETDATAKRNFDELVKDEGKTVKLEEQYANMKKRINDLIEINPDPKFILDSIKRDKDNYGLLFELDDTIENGGELVKTTRPIDYRWSKIEQDVLARCGVLKNETIQAIDMAADMLGDMTGGITQPANTPVPQESAQPQEPIVTEQGKLQEQNEQIALNTISPTISEKGTEADNLVFKHGRTTRFGETAGKVSGITLPPEQAAENYGKKLNEKANTQYASSTKTVREYETIQNERDAYKREQAENEDRISSLEARLDVTGGMNAWDAEWTKKLTESEGWEQAKEQIQSDDPSEQWLGYAYVFNFDPDGTSRRFDGSFLDAGRDLNEVFQNYPDLKEIADAAIEGNYENTTGLQPLTINEEEELEERYNNRKLLVDRIGVLNAQLNQGKDSYQEARKVKDSLRNGYALYNKATGGSDDYLAKFDAWDQASSEWTAYPFTSYSPYDEAIATGANADYVASSAAYNLIGITQTLNGLAEIAQNPQAYGFNPTSEELKNVKQKVAVLQKQQNEASRYLLTTLPEFADEVEEGKHMSLDGMSQLTKDNVNALLNNKWPEGGKEFVRQFSNGTDFEDYGNASLSLSAMTDKDKDLYFYYLSVKGEDAANEYLADIVNPTNGMIPHRAMEQKNQETVESVDNGLSAVGNWLGAFYMNFAGNITSWGQQRKYEILGVDNYDPNGLSFMGSETADSMRAGVTEWLVKEMGEENREFTEFLMNSINSAGDSALNALATSGAFKVIGSAVPALRRIGAFIEAAEKGQYGRFVKVGAKAFDDWSHSITMASFAADRAYRDAIGSGASIDQAKRMSNATFWAESISEAVTVGNIKEMWDKGGAGEVKNILKELFTNGMEEAVGEGFNQWWENNADNIIMGELSKQKQKIEALVEAGIPRSQAERLAEEQAFKDIAVAAASGFVSSGFSSTGSYLTGRVKSTFTEGRQADMVKNDLAKLETAKKYVGGTNGTIAISAVLRNDQIGGTAALRNGIEADAASVRFVGQLNNGDPGNAISVTEGIVTNAGNQVEGAKRALTYASLTMGKANDTLRYICERVAEGGNVTAQDVNDLLDAVDEDQTDDENNAAYLKNVTDYRVATRKAQILATSMQDAVKAVKESAQKVEEAKATAEDAANRKADADAHIDAVTENLNSAVGEQVETATDDGNGPVQQQCNELEGAITDQQQKEAILQQTEAKAEQAEQEYSDKQDEVMNEAGQQAQADVAQEDVQIEQQAQQEFQENVAKYHPTQAFSKPVTVQKMDGTGSVQVTGVFDIAPGGITIYTTDKGYISDNELDAFEDEDLPEIDKALDHWKNGFHPVKPAAWLSHSLKATVDSTGDTVDIIGFAGQNEGQYMMMDSNGNVYGYEDVTIEPDPYTGDNGYDTLDSEWENADGDNLPEYTGPMFNDIESEIESFDTDNIDLDLDEEGATLEDENTDEFEPVDDQDNGTQMPEGFVEYPGEPVNVTLADGKTIAITGLVRIDGVLHPVGADGTVVTADNPVASGGEDVIQVINWGFHNYDDALQAQSAESETITSDDVNNSSTAPEIAVYDQDADGKKYISFHGDATLDIPGWGNVKVIGARPGLGNALRLVFESAGNGHHSVSVSSVFYEISQNQSVVDWMNSTVIPEIQSGNMEQQTGKAISLDNLSAIMSAFGNATSSAQTQQSTAQQSTVANVSQQEETYDNPDYDVSVVYDGNGSSASTHLMFPYNEEMLQDVSGAIAEGFTFTDDGIVAVKMDSGVKAGLALVFGTGEQLDSWLANHHDFRLWVKQKVIPSFEHDGLYQFGTNYNSEGIQQLKDFFKLDQLGQQSTSQQSTTPSANYDEYSEGKVNPKTGAPLKNWQDPKYHGKPKKTTKKTNFNTSDFKKWFNAENIPEKARPYLMNPDGTPRVFFHGYGAYGKTLYNVHQSKKKLLSNGKEASFNFYFLKKEMAAKYAGTTKISHLRYIDNWETAKEAMKDIQYDLIEAPNPNGNGKMGYQVIESVGGKAYGKLGSTWFAENELNRFRKQYGGGLKSQGIHAGYITAQNPLVIDGLYCNYSNVTATVTAPDGDTMSGTYKTRRWAEWAFDHGYDMCIFDEVQDAPGGSGGPHGVEIITSQPQQFKSVYNSGKFSKNDGDIMAFHAKDEKAESKGLQAVRKVLSKAKVEDMSYEERVALRDQILSVPEIKKLAEQATASKPTLPYEVQSAIRHYNGSEESIQALRDAGVKDETIELLKNGGDYFDAIESLFTPENVEEQHRVRDYLAYERGSAVFDEKGKTQYTGKVDQGKRLDVIVGLPASGKSTLADAISAEHRSRFCDNDDAKKAHKNYADGANSSPLHNESRFITDQAMNIMINNGDNVVLPVVGHSFSSVARQIKTFKDAGYEVHLHDVQLPWAKAIERTLNRTLSDNRLLDIGYITGTDGENGAGLSPMKIEKAFNRLVEEGYADGYAVWNNDVAKGAPPIPVSSSSESETDIKAGAFGKAAGGSSALAGGRGTNVHPGGMAGPSGEIKQFKVTQNKNGIREIEATEPKSNTERQAKKVKAKLKSPQDIAQNLMKDLGIGYYGTNKFGNISKKTRGYYDPHGNYIAARNSEIGNPNIVFHESGHGLAELIGITGTPEMVDAMIELNRKQDGEKLDVNEYSPEQLQDEALAEFFRYYLTDEQDARNFAGDSFVDDFERRLAMNPKAYNAVMKAREDYQTFLEADAADRLDTMIKYEKSGERLNVGQFVQNAVAMLADRSVATEDIMQFLREVNGGDVDMSENLRGMALLSNHSQKMTVNILKDNLTDSNGTIVGDGLGKIASKVGFVGTEENIRAFERYVLACHALERADQGKPVFAEVNLSKEMCEKIIKETPQVVKDFEEGFQAFRHNFLQLWMVNTGYMSQDLLNKLEDLNKHYAPTFRVGGVSSMNGVGGKTGKGYTMREAVGGSQDIYSPLYSFIGMVDQIVTMVNNNRVAQTFDNIYREYPGLGEWARPVPGPATVNDKAIIQEQLQDLLEGKVEGDVMEQILKITDSIPSRGNNDASQRVLHVRRTDGTTARYEFTEDGEQLYKLLAGVQERTNIKVLNIVGGLTRTMSMLTTGSNPLFAARNAVRDYQSSVNYGTWAKSYLTGIPTWLKSFAEVWAGKSDAYQQYKALGGGGWTRIDQNNRKSMNAIQEDIFGADKSTAGKKAKYGLSKFVDFVTFEKVNEAIEQASRFAEFKHGKHDLSTVEGRQEAFLAAQDVTVDFSRSGNSELAQVLKKLVPFFNASTQGVYRTARQFSQAERGMNGETLGETANNFIHSPAAARFTKTIVNTALMSALCSGLIMKFGSDDDKDEFANILSSGIKANHFILPNPFKGESGAPFIRIPIGQDPLMYAVHAAVTNAMWNGSADEYAISLAATTDVILDNLNPLGSGTIAQPFIDVSHNRTWYGSRLVRSNMEDWTDPASQYNEDTPMAFRWLGRLLNISPEVAEYLTTQYTGFVGAMAIPMLSYNDNGRVGGFKAAMDAYGKKWTADPQSSNDATNRFYDMVANLETIKDEAKKDRPQGLLLRSLTQDQVNNAYLEAETMLGTDGIVASTKKIINDGYKKIDEINGSDLDDAMKAKLCRDERRNMIKAVEAANAQLEGFTKKYITGEKLTDRVFGALMKRNPFDGGKYAQIPTDKERMGQTFQDDMDKPYMQFTLGFYDEVNAMSEDERKATFGSNTNVKSLLPEPVYEFSLKSGGVSTDYVIPEEDRTDYDNVYKQAYMSTLTYDAGAWNSMTPKEKRSLISKARSNGNEAVKQLYADEHGIIRDK